MKAHRIKIVTIVLGAATLVTSIGSLTTNVAAFDGKAASSYAMKWSGCVPPYTYNPYYEIPGWREAKQDCTNFASQCLNAAGWPMTSNMATGLFSGTTQISRACWYFFNSTNPFTGTKHQSWSSTWTLVDKDALCYGLKEFTTAYAFVTQNVNLNRDYTQLISKYGVQEGDVIQFDFDNDGNFTHSVIVTNAFHSGTDIVQCTYHSNDTIMNYIGNMMMNQKNVKINIIHTSWGHYCGF